MKKVKLKLLFENDKFNVRAFKDNTPYLNKEFDDEVDACEYLGWLEEFYVRAGVNLTEVIL